MVVQKLPKAEWIDGFSLSLVSFPLTHGHFRSSEAGSTYIV